MGDAQPKRKSGRRALHAPKAWLTLLIVLGAGLTLDLWSKDWSFQNVAHEPVVLDRAQIVADPFLNQIPPHEPMVVLPRVLNFQLVQNRGAVFGIGADQRFFFIVFTVTALLAGLWIFARRTTSSTTLAHMGLGFILAGGLGNLHDRIAFAAVRDFVHALPGWSMPFGWTWPGGSTELFPWVFNFADVMLLLGVLLLMVHINRVERARRCNEAAEAAPAPAQATTD
jgi:signal peptidase II